MHQSSAKACSITGCERPWHRREWCAMHYQRWYRHDDPLWEKPPLPPCWCGEPYRARGLCRKHYAEWQRQQAGGSQTAAGRRARYAKKRGVVIVTCLNPECDQPFERPNRHGQPARYCSDGCRRRASVLRMKAWVEANPERAKELRGAAYAKYCALKRGATPPGEVFTLNEIYERDGGICYLCGLHVDPQHRSMDHVIPVSKGGAHARANVRLAHRRCNSRKNARILSA